MVHSIWNTQPEIQQALHNVKEQIKKDLRMPHQEVKEKIIDYVDAPGKYIRAGLLLMMAQGIEGHISDAKMTFAAAVEVLHLATLIHDDVIDEADTRRGIDVLHKTSSNRIAIYAGDYLLAYAGRLLKRGVESLYRDEEKVDEVIDERIIERILAGELAQLLNQNRIEMTMKDYLKQIKGKTAFLFALSCQLGAWKHPINRKDLKAAFQAGQAIGMAFQLSDDLLDYQVSESQMGKPALQDVQNGIYTAPLLLAMREDTSLREWLRTKHGLWTGENLRELQERIGVTSAYDQSTSLIRNYLEKTSQYLGRIEFVDSTEIELLLQIVMKRSF